MRPEVHDRPASAVIPKEHPVGEGRDRRTLPARGEVRLAQVTHERAAEAGGDGGRVEKLPGDGRPVDDRLAVHGDQVRRCARVQRVGDGLRVSLTESPGEPGELLGGHRLPGGGAAKIRAEGSQV